MAKSLLEAAKEHSGRRYATWFTELSAKAQREIVDTLKEHKDTNSNVSMSAIAREIVKRFGVRGEVETLAEKLTKMRREL